MGIDLKAHMVHQFREYRMIHYLEGSDNPPSVECLKFKKGIDHIIAGLPELERTLIQLRYLDPDSDYIKDHQIMDKMQISRMTFMKIRDSAFQKLATAMGINIENGAEEHG